MKRTISAILLFLVLSTGARFRAHAQYYQIASQLPDLISPALSGSFQYRGFVEASGLAGIGPNRANFLGVSTTQGFQYASWFFMGVGAGVDVAMAHKDDIWNIAPSDTYSDNDGWDPARYASTRVMIPLFSDFRFRLGQDNTVSYFLDIKLGASWIIGNKYLAMRDRCLTTNTQFYFRPGIGLRIPVDSKNYKHAVNIAVTYQLQTTNNNWGYYYDNGCTTSHLGGTVGYQW